MSRQADDDANTPSKEEVIEVKTEDKKENKNPALSIDQEHVPDSIIDKETEHKIAHVVGEDVIYFSTCDYCEVAPCLMEQGLYEVLEKEHDYVHECDTEQALTNKEVRFKLYRTAMHWIHSYLGHGNRQELPLCVQGEIMDLAHEAGGKYTGYRDK